MEQGSPDGHSNRMRGNRHKLEHGKFQLHMGNNNFLCLSDESGQILGWIIQRSCGRSIFGGL